MNTSSKIDMFFEKYLDENVGRSLVVDFNTLRTYDSMLADLVLTKPEEMIENFEKVLYKKFRRKIKVYFINIPKLRRITPDRIEPGYVDQLVSLEGLVSSMEKQRSSVTILKVRCRNCGSITEMENRKRRCPHCRSGKTYVLKERYAVSFQKIRISGMDVYLYDDLTDNIDIGDNIEVVGILKERARGTSVERYINAVGIVKKERKINIEITEKDIKNIKRIAKENPLEKLASNFAPYIPDLNEIKKAIVLQLFSKPPDRVNILVTLKDDYICEELKKAVKNVAPISQHVFCGWRGREIFYEREANEIRAGNIVFANDGICFFEWIDMLTEGLNVFSNILRGKKVGLNKIKYNFSVLATTKFKEGNSIENMTKLKPYILKGFDLIFVINIEEDKKLIEQFTKFILKERKIKQEIKNEVFKKYIAVARKIEPKITEEMEEKIIKEREKLCKNIKKLKVFSKDKVFKTLIKLAKASARIRLSEEVGGQDIKTAAKLIRISMKHAYPEVFDEEKVCEMVKEILKIKECADFEEIIKKAKDKGVKEEKVKEIIEKLVKEGKLKYCVKLAKSF